MKKNYRVIALFTENKTLISGKTDNKTAVQLLKFYIESKNVISANITDLNGKILIKG
jgi:hypothetical protein